MNNALGKILIIISMQLYLFAYNDLANYTLTASSYDVYEKEAIEIRFRAKQLQHDYEMFFFLEVNEAQNYKIIYLDKKTKELGYHDRETTFRYLVFPLKSGKLEIGFDFIIKTASDEAIAQVYRGSRDNVKLIETINTEIDLAPLILNVKALKSGIDLVGDFKLTQKLKEDEIDAYKSANISYTLEGIGYDDIGIAPINKIDGVEIFEEQNLLTHKATKDGYKIKKIFNYALISNKDFNIDAKKINCFSPKSLKYYTLHVDKQNIKVNQVKASTLLDISNYPEQTSSFGWLKDLFIYIIIFMVGYISAKIIPKRKIKLLKTRNHGDIEDTKTPKELLYVLANNYSKYDFKDESDKLEAIVYKKDVRYSFRTIKKELLEKLNSEM